SLITYHTGQLSLEKYKPDILISISHECCGTFEFYKAEEMIAAGKSAAVKSLEVYEGLEVRG
ncbi:MAG: rssA, partial [Mucilaginibacter sp.]|nr:rssA [Mucilaginibacter sp.]